MRCGNLREPVIRTNQRFTVTNFPEIATSASPPRNDILAGLYRSSYVVIARKEQRD